MGKTTQQSESTTTTRAECPVCKSILRAQVDQLLALHPHQGAAVADRAIIPVPDVADFIEAVRLRDHPLARPLSVEEITFHAAKHELQPKLPAPVANTQLATVNVGQGEVLEVPRTLDALDAVIALGSRDLRKQTIPPLVLMQALKLKYEIEHSSQPQEDAVLTAAKKIIRRAEDDGT